MMINTGKFKNYGAMEELASGSANIESYVCDRGHILTKEQAEAKKKSGPGYQEQPLFHTAEVPNFAASKPVYWYEKENGALLQFEKQCFFQFLKEYNNPDAMVRFGFDSQNHFCADVVMPVKIDNLPWRTFKFRVIYQHDHPGRDSDGMFGGSIRIYFLDKLKPGFHHQFMDHALGGAPYICQAKTLNSAEVNGYAAMKRAHRAVVNYLVWEKTGVDPDRDTYKKRRTYA